MQTVDPVVHENARHAPKPRRDWLVTTACVFVILASVNYAAQSVKEFVRGFTISILPLRSSISANTTFDAAHIVVTNEDTITVSVCYKGVVANKLTKASTESVHVCTGRLESRSTVKLDAPYEAGKVAEICPGKLEGLVDWSKCTFDAVNLLN